MRMKSRVIEGPQREIRERKKKLVRIGGLGNTLGGLPVKGFVSLGIILI
jgi:hypothetical protein